MPALPRVVVKDHRREHVAVLGDRQRRHPQLDRLIEQLLDAAGAVEQRVLGVQVEMDEIGHLTMLNGDCRSLMLIAIPLASALAIDDMSFPLDRRRRLRADVVDDAVDALDLVDDARRDARRAARAAAAPSRRSCRPGSRRRGSRSCTRRCARRPSRRRSAPAAARRRTATAAGTTRPCVTSSATMRRRAAAASGATASPRRESAPPGPGPGNGCRHTNSSSSPSSCPTARTSSLNSCAQRLDQLEPHALGQAADVVMALDDVRRPDRPTRSR